MGTILSTLTSDVQTIQSFASVATLNMFTNTLTVVGMIVVMFLCRWDFTLIALAVTPLLTIFVLRQQGDQDSRRGSAHHQSDLVATLQEGLQSIQVVQAFGREDHQERQVRTASMNTVTAWLNARRVSSLLSPIVGLAIALCTGLVLWRGSLLILSGTMTVGALTVFLAYLAKFFQPVRDLAQMTNSIAAVSVAFERVVALSDADKVIPEHATPMDPPQFRGEISFDHVTFGYDPQAPVLRDITFTISPGQMVGIVGPTGSGKSTIAGPSPGSATQTREPHDRRREHPPLRAAQVAGPERLCPSRHGVTARHRARQHRLWPPRRHRRRSRTSGRTGQRP